MIRFLRALLIPACLLPRHMATAQTMGLSGSAVGGDVMVEATWENDGDTLPLFRVLWRSIDGGQAEARMQRLRSETIDRRLMLDRLVEAAVGAYLDARVHFTRDGVRGDLAADAMTRDINGMIAAAIGMLGAEVEFTGLTTPTRQQLDRLLRIDWSQARFGVDGGTEQDKYLAIYYYVRTQREELERQMRADLLPLSTIAVIGPQQAAPGTTVRINSTCGTVFDEQNFLCALDLRLADSGNGGGIEPVLSAASIQALATTAGTSASAAAAPSKVRRRDRWLKEELEAINARIDRMDQRKELWELRDRMDDMEDRITGIEMEVGDMRSEVDNPSANLAALTGRNITVRFERNSTDLEPDQRVLLNEVFEQLARSPQERVLITGFTDRSGDPGRNLWLSEQRAKAVRAYLMERGILAERLLVNYYGDSRSMGRDPGERRVEVEWIR